MAGVPASVVVIRIKRKRDETPLDCLLVSSAAPTATAQAPGASSRKRPKLTGLEGLMSGLLGAETAGGGGSFGAGGGGLSPAAGEEGSVAKASSLHQNHLLFTRVGVGTGKQEHPEERPGGVPSAGAARGRTHLMEVGRRRARLRQREAEDPADTDSRRANRGAEEAPPAPDAAAGSDAKVTVSVNHSHGDRVHVIDLMMKGAPAAAAASPATPQGAEASPEGTNRRSSSRITCNATPAASELVLNPMERLMDEAIAATFCSGDCTPLDSALRMGGQVDYQRRGSDFTTALMAAANAGNLHVVAQLLAKGANPSLVDMNGNDAGDVALRKGHMEVLKVLQKGVASRGRWGSGGQAEEGGGGRGRGGAGGAEYSGMTAGSAAAHEGSVLEAEYVYDLYSFTPGAGTGVGGGLTEGGGGLAPHSTAVAGGGARDGAGGGSHDMDLDSVGLATVSLEGIEDSSTAARGGGVEGGGGQGQGRGRSLLRGLDGLELDEDEYEWDGLMRYGREDDDDDDEDSNAEDFHGNDYPEDEYDGSGEDDGERPARGGRGGGGGGARLGDGSQHASDWSGDSSDEEGRGRSPFSVGKGRAGGTKRMQMPGERPRGVGGEHGPALVCCSPRGDAGELGLEAEAEHLEWMNYSAGDEREGYTFFAYSSSSSGSGEE